MTDIIASEDASSSSSSCINKSVCGPLGGHKQQQQQQQLSPFSQSTTTNNNNQQQQQTVMKSPPSSMSSSSSSGPKRPRFLQKLDIAPRELTSLNQVSVVKLSSTLSSSSSSSGSANKTSTTGFNSSSVSPSVSSVLSVASSSTNSPSNQQQQQQQKNENKPTSQQQQQEMMNPINQEQDQQQQQSRAWSNSTIGSSASTISSPQVNSQNNSPQFKTKVEEIQQNQQQQQRSSSLQFTASLVHPNIYLGAAMDAMSAATLIAHGIFYILNVAYECDFSDSVSAENRIQKKKIDLRDSVQENIERAFEDAFAFIDEAINKGVKILVHCFVGSSRSATIVIGYLMKKLFANNNHHNNIECFETSKRSVIEQHQEKDRTRTLVSSPTMTIESLMSAVNKQQQQQQQSFNFAPTTLTTTAIGDADDDPFASASEFISDFDIVSSASASSYTAQQQHQGDKDQQEQQQSKQRQQHQQRFSFYQSALEQVQKIRPEVLPNLAFSFALQKMDSQLLLRATA